MKSMNIRTALMPRTEAGLGGRSVSIVSEVRTGAEYTDAGDRLPRMDSNHE
jgi:hypothetical protein